jgi:hypothetical protein
VAGTDDDDRAIEPRGHTVSGSESR